MYLLPPPPPSTITSTVLGCAAASDRSVPRIILGCNGLQLRSQKAASSWKTTSSPLDLDLPFSSLALRPGQITASAPATDGDFASTAVGTPPYHQLSRWSLGRGHLLLLNFAACAAAISSSWLFFSAIPTLLAFKKAAESLEKLLDVTAQELPDTMAAIRLSGMEISDLTMELSDLGQEISQGVKSSTRAVRVAEERLRRLTTMSPAVPVQNQIILRDKTQGTTVARTARNLHDGIVKGRSFFGLMFSITRISRWALDFLISRRRKKMS